jgi:cystathionine gamma-synthase
MSDSSTPKDRPHGLATDLLHADDELHGPEVSPSISVTTSSSFSSYPDTSGHHTSWAPGFRQTESPEFTVQDYLEHTELVRSSNVHVYSRISQSVSTRVEHVLSKINVSTHALLDEKHRVSLQGR